MPNFTKTKLITIVIILAFTLGWCFAIFKLSSMNSQNSNHSSTSIVETSIIQILKVTNAYEITNSHPDAESLAKAAKLINAPLRKAVHASVYCVLAVLLIVTGVILFEHKYYFRITIGVLVFCFIFAFLDEYHQTFVDGRTGQMFDVFIDTFGATIGIIFASTYQLAWWLGRRGVTENNPKAKH